MYTSYNNPCGMKCRFHGCLSKRKNDSSITPRSYFSFSKDSSRYVLFLYFIKMSFLPYYLKHLYLTYFIFKLIVHHLWKRHSNCLAASLFANLLTIQYLMMSSFYQLYIIYYYCYIFRCTVWLEKCNYRSIICDH